MRPSLVCTLTLTLFACHRPEPLRARGDASLSRAPASPHTADTVRAWIDRTAAASWLRGARIEPASAFDTREVTCVRAIPEGLPPGASGIRIVCVHGDDVLAGEEGYARYLTVHAFDPEQSRPAAIHLVRLRDAMLGFTAREVDSVRAEVSGDALVVDAQGRVRTSTERPEVPQRWRIRIGRDGHATEEPITD